MKAFMIPLVILSVAFSGCVTTGDGNSDDGTSGMPTDDDFQGLDIEVWNMKTWKGAGMCLFPRR